MAKETKQKEFWDIINELSLWNKIMLGSAVVFLIAMFLPWRSAGIMSVSGMTLQGWILLPAAICAGYLAYSETVKQYKLWNYILNGIAIVIMIVMLADSNVNAFGNSIFTGTVWLFIALASFIVNLTATYKITKE